MSSTAKPPSLMTAFVNSGLRTAKRPISARNWISRNETGETPHGRYRSSQGNFAIRLDPRTSQIRKCVSSKSVNVVSAAGKRRCPQALAIPMTTDLPGRHWVRAEVSCIAECPRYSSSLWYPPGATRDGDLSAERRLLRRSELRPAGGTNVFWLQMH